MLGGVDDQRPVPLQQPVEDLEVGDELEDAVAAEPPRFVERRGDETGGEAARRWQGDNAVLQHHGEDVLQDEAEHEDRHRHSGIGDNHRADIGSGVALVGGDDAERNADDDGERQRHDRQLDRRRQALDQNLGDGSALRERLTEITVEKVPEVVEELDDERLVESLALVEGVADLVRRPFAEGRPTRVAGDDAGEDEHRDDDPEQHRDRRHRVDGA